MMIHLTSKKAISMVLISDFDIRTFYALRNAGVFHYVNYRFVSGPYTVLERDHSVQKICFFNFL